MVVPPIGPGQRRSRCGRQRHDADDSLRSGGGRPVSGCLMMDGDGKSLEYQDVDIFFQYVIHNIDYICMYNVYIYIYCMYVCMYVCIYIYTHCIVHI